MNVYTERTPVTVSVKKAPAIDHTNAYYVTVNDVSMYVVWTGNDGKGLWIDGEQVEGRAQFSAGKTPREKIRRWFQSRGF